MRIKKTAIAIITFSVIAMVIGANFADAQVYTPLVQIPGLPPGAVDLSMYLVGLYDFLLSIVGIVAVMMLIIGGMRYITAAGNQAAVADAKDIITNALLGLLLAILSWVIVAEINPDVLYIKKPGGAFVSTTSWNLEQCGVFDPAAPAATSCTCNYPRNILHNPPIVPPPTLNIIGAGEGVTDQATCDHECRRLGFCSPLEKYCIVSGTPNNDLNKELTKSFGGKCQCIDGTPLLPVGDDCHETCAPNNCFVVLPEVGWIPNDASYSAQQLRDFAVEYPGDINHPYTLAEDAFFSMDMDKSSIVYNEPAVYKLDTNGDDDCDDPGDLLIEGTPRGLPGNWQVFLMGKSSPVPPFCKLTLTPNGETCVQKICGVDSLNHTAAYYIYSTTLYQ